MLVRARAFVCIVFFSVIMEGFVPQREGLQGMSGILSLDLT